MSSVDTRKFFVGQGTVVSRLSLVITIIMFLLVRPAQCSPTQSQLGNISKIQPSISLIPILQISLFIATNMIEISRGYIQGLILKFKIGKHPLLY